ncbi:Dps family protein [Peptostreptococcus faecalis]|uniref:Dps family protein n=1 Tax=Peptostreptococcus faecalis TaxID=2045015 RepID=UPI000C7DF61F|nr:DNA starvation/stationary phase protection protein [Peptostreptococcus faecalis]
MKKELSNEVNIYLANIGVSYIKLHNLHWNVVGSQFKAVHEYLETLYDAMADVLDATAELLKMNGEMPMASMKDYLAVATINELESSEVDANSVMNTVLNDMEDLKIQALSIRKLASEEDQFDVVSAMENDIENYNKTIWFIKSMLK